MRQDLLPVNAVTPINSVVIFYDDRGNNFGHLTRLSIQILWPCGNYLHATHNHSNNDNFLNRI